jgi:hypothetical protein
MLEPSTAFKYPEAYEPILESLKQRRKVRDAATGPQWLHKLLGIAIWLAMVVAPTLLVFAGTGALAGWSRPFFMYPLMVAALSLCLASAVVFLALADQLIRGVRHRRKRPTQTQLIISDCMVAERLASCSKPELKMLRHVLAARLKRLRASQAFVLGPAAKISPFLIGLLVLLLSKTELTGLLTQVAPWATDLASSALGAFALCLVTFAVVLVRFMVYWQEETVGVDLMLIDGALERINSTTTDQGENCRTPAAIGLRSNGQTADDGRSSPGALNG